jgi:hypothetical protein
MSQLPYGDRVYQIPRCWNCATFTLAEKSARTPKKPASSETWRSHARSKAQCCFHLCCSSLWLLAVECCADKRLCAVAAQLGWSDPTNYFGHGNVHKSGVAPAQSGVLFAPKLTVVPCATYSAAGFSENPTVNRNVNDRVNYVFHAPFTLGRKMPADN